ncbi:fibroblast growth factor 22 [Apus apus]|uniref:fibroblast growth factor 22 n=1 Tax=Apus apus TaxID=8895 RepID=UPI0021F8E677|nr:fibroblast growth factor 22 [Apus apus]
MPRRAPTAQAPREARREREPRTTTPRVPRAPRAPWRPRRPRLDGAGAEPRGAAGAALGAGAAPRPSRPRARHCPVRKQTPSPGLGTRQPGVPSSPAPARGARSLREPVGTRSRRSPRRAPHDRWGVTGGAGAPPPSPPASPGRSPCWWGRGRGRGRAALPGAAGGPPRSYGHLEGDVRWRRLFSATRFFLRIDGGGRVEGTRWRERPGSIVEIRSVRVGVVAIRAVHTGFYLAMNKQGRLYGSKEFSPNCKFMERIEENGYNTYASLRWRHRGRPMFLSLNSQGRPWRGGRTRRQHLSTHFLPILVS